MYRTQGERLGPRWGITWKKRWYVRIKRIFVDIREPYMAQREWNDYERRLAEYHRAADAWNREDTWYDRAKRESEVHMRLWPDSRPTKPQLHFFARKGRPPMPLPPPIRIME